MKKYFFTFVLIVFGNYQRAMADTNVYQDLAGAGAAARAGADLGKSALEKAFLPLTGLIDCMNHKLQICRPQASYVVLTCASHREVKIMGRTNHYTSIYKDQISEYLRATYLDEDRNEKVLPNSVVWETTQDSYAYDTGDIDSIDRATSRTNELVKELKLQCQQMIRKHIANQAGGFPIK